MVALVFTAGLYNIYRVAWRFDPARPRARGPWISLGVDVVLCIILIQLSGGLDSAFLIYSLSPVLTASLLISARAAMAVASISALSVSGAYIAAGLGVGDFPWLLSGNYLAFSLLYGSVCLLSAYLPSVANLNWQRRVRAESQASERHRLRRDVHDNVAQTLAFLSLKMRRAEQRSSEAKNALTVRDVRDIGSAVERAYLSVRDYLDGVDEPETGESLEARLVAMVEQLCRDTGLRVRVKVSGEEQELPRGVKHQMHQVAREALANVAKHAYPSKVWVELEFTRLSATIRVRDDGRGFSVSGLRGHGMDIMNERSALVGASVTIDSAPGEGTQVTVAYSTGAEEGDS
jgi:signal transduction histidine kinase